MKILLTPCLWGIIILSPILAGSATDSKVPPAPSIDISHLKIEIQRLKNIYQYKYIKDFSDHKIIEDIGAASRNEPSFIDDLIELCKIKEIPGSTQKYSLLSLSPAGRELEGLGSKARTRIDAALTNKNLTSWQRAVLEQVQSSVAWREAKDKGLPLPPEYKPRYFSRGDFDYVTPETADILTSDPPPEWLFYGPRPSSDPKVEPPPPAPSSTSSGTPAHSIPQTQPLPHSAPTPQAPPTSEPAPPFPWIVATALAAAILAGAWLLLRKRKGQEAR